MELKLKGTHRGFEYMVLTMDMGHRCGYVRVPESHPLYGKHYQEEEVYSLDVHGGITFSRHVTANQIEFFSEGYWIGFDCNHCFDMPDPDEMTPEFRKLQPRMKEMEKKFENMFDALLGVEPWMKTKRPESKIRNDRYVESQCRNLCEQLAGMKGRHV